MSEQAWCWEQPWHLERVKEQEIFCRRMGFFRVADQLRRLGEILTTGRECVHDCEWIDRGAAQMPDVMTFDRDDRIRVNIGHFTIHLTQDAARSLWDQLTQVVFRDPHEASTAAYELPTVSTENEVK